MQFISPRRMYFGLIAVAVFLVTMPAAMAQNGVILIDSTAIWNGRFTCGQALNYADSGFPVRICQPGSYRLASNLTVPNPNINAVEITADNVTLDLNGFTISGPGTTGTGVGILSSSHNGITVLNGTIRGMGNDGIRIYGSMGITVDRVAALNNGGHGINVLEGNVTNCNVNGNSHAGIWGTVSTTVSLNTVTYNGGTGIWDCGTVTNNSVNHNGGQGIENGTTVIGNTVTYNDAFGLKNYVATGYAHNVMYMNSSGSTNGIGVSINTSNVCNGAGC